MSPLVATEPIIRARLRKATDKHYRSGVLGLRAQPVWDGADFDHDGVPVIVIACPSVLSIWEAIDGRDADGWTVVLTAVGDDDLGDTVLAHLLDQRLITPDPWDALRGNFSASTIEPALYRGANDRAVANGLLAVLPSYTPAPGGVLTRDHALTAVAREVLGMVKDVDTEVDTFAVLEWSRSPGISAGLAELRAHPELAAVVTDWLAQRSGKLAGPVTALLNADRIADLVPLGVVAGLFCQPDRADGVALGRFLGRFDLNADHLDDWYSHSRGLVTSSLAPDQRQVVLQAAAAIVDDLGITSAAAASDLLPHGLEARIDALADAVAGSTPSAVEARWTEVGKHLLAASSPTVDAFAGAVRLVRWLHAPTGTGGGLAAATASYVTEDSWADTALVKARRGAEHPVAAAALRSVIDTALARRADIDRTFAAALADSPQPAVAVIENVLRERVVPIARRSATLLLVIDALSMAAANDLAIAMQQDGWTEIAAGDGAQRATALAVLPSMTQRSRCSLLCGELREGPDTVERSGFLALLKETALHGVGGPPDPIFHKSALDAIPSGASLATDVNNAIADTDNRPLVAAVLNYVDDTLHHTDPGGTDWTIGTITHLRALLRAAKSAGRAVVITSDHGHVIDYGTGVRVARANVYAQRAHGDLANVDAVREVVVEGPRVLTGDHRVVLAVDETIRYGARNAGYHGGASAAEVVVPVLAFVPGLVPEWATAVVGAEPSWWHAGATPAPVHEGRTSVPSLFDVGVVENALPDKVIRSRVFDAQWRLAGRLAVKPAQIRALLSVLVDTHEITSAQAAAALGVATASVNGALMQTKRVLDVEGYEVLRVARDAVSLDVAALTEQFGVRA